MYNEVKLALTVSKGQLTKSVTKLEESCVELSKMPAELPTSSKIRVAAGLLKALEIVSEKSKEVRKNRDKWLNAVVKYDPIEFEKDSKKTKDQLIENSEKNVERYEERADQCIKAHNMEINEAEKWLADSMAPKAQAPSSSEVDQWSQFKPQ